MSGAGGAMSVRTRPLPPYAAVDLLAVVVLSAISLAGFSDTFAGIRWIVVAAAGVALGLGLDAAPHHPAARAGVVMPLVPVPYLLTAGLVALGSSGLFLGVPNIETINAVAIGTVESWRVLVETAPLVDSAGGVLLIPYALALLPVAVSSALALRAAGPRCRCCRCSSRWSRPGPRRADPFSTLLQGIGFGAVALAWCAPPGAAVRGRAGQRPPGGLGVRAPAPGRVAVLGPVAAARTSWWSSPRAPAPGAARGRGALRLGLPDVAAVGVPPLPRPGPGGPRATSPTEALPGRGAGPGAGARRGAGPYDGTRWYAKDDTSPDDSPTASCGSRRGSTTRRGARSSSTPLRAQHLGPPWVPTWGRCRPSSPTTTTPATGSGPALQPVNGHRRPARRLRVRRTTS